MSSESFSEPTDARQTELLYRLRHDCGSCHGMTLKGGLGPSLLPTELNDSTTEELVEVILHGVKGTPMPPWDFEVSKAEATWLVGKLKKGLDNE